MKNKPEHRTAVEMTPSELRMQSNTRLDDLERDAREQLLSMRTHAAQLGYGRRKFSSKPHYFSLYRRAIARIQTIRGERNR